MKLNASKKYFTFLSLALIAGLAQNACSSDDDNGDGDGTGGKPSGDGDGDGTGGKKPDGEGGQGGQSGEGDVDPLYAVTTQVFDGTAFTSYVVLTDSMEAGDLSTDDGIEIAGRSLGVGPNEGGALFVTSGEGPELTRYDLSEEGTLKKGETVSFLPAGLTSIGEYQGQFQFVSEEKAYFFDGSTGKIIVWNPKEMTYTKSISLADLVHADETLTFGGAPIVQDDKIIAFPGLAQL